MGKPPVDDLASNRLEEWKAARDVLQGFDSNLHDIRKYGFTVAAALLAFNSILLPSSIGGKDALTDQVKLAAIGSMMLLVVALTYIEKNYRLFLDAAATRARNLERVMNFELTEKIAGRSKRSYEMAHADLVYFFFLVAVFALGLAVVSPSLPLTFGEYTVLGVSAAFSTLLTLGSVVVAAPSPGANKPSVVESNPTLVAVRATPAISMPSFVELKQSAGRRILGRIAFAMGIAIFVVDLGVFYLFFHLPDPGVWILIALFSFFSVASGVMILIPTRLSPTKMTLDWTVDRLQCKIGEAIQVTVTNLGEDLGFGANSVMFWVETQKGVVVEPLYKIPANVPPDYDHNHDKDHFWLGAWESYAWSWEPREPGIYRIVRYKLDDKGPVWKPLQRTFTVTSEKHKFQITTTDELVHDCEVTGGAVVVLVEEGYERISCTSHGRSLAGCLGGNVKIKNVGKIAS